MFLDAKYFPPPSLDGPKGKEIDENLSGLLTFFATKTAAKRAANVIPVYWCQSKNYYKKMIGVEWNMISWMLTEKEELMDSFRNEETA